MNSRMIDAAKRRPPSLKQSSPVREDRFANQKPPSPLKQAVEPFSAPLQFMEPLESRTVPMQALPQESQQMSIESNQQLDSTSANVPVAGELNDKKDFIDTENLPITPANGQLLTTNSDQQENNNQFVGQIQTQNSDEVVSEKTSEGGGIPTATGLQIPPEGQPVAGGGAAAVTSPTDTTLDESDSLSLINSWGKSSPNSFLAKGALISSSLTNAQKGEKTTLEESLPTIEQPTGLPPKHASKEGVEPMALGTETSLEMTPEGEKVEIPKPEKVLVSTVPVNNAPIPTGLDSAPAETEEEGWWSRISGKIQSFLSGIQTSDATVSTETGPAPKVPTEGEADPAQNATHQEEADEALLSNKKEADQAIGQDFGENDLYPIVDPVPMSPEVELSEPPAVPESTAGTLESIHPDAMSGFDRESPPVLDEQINAELSKAEAERTTMDQKSTEERMKADEQIAAESEKTTIEQEAAQLQSRSEVDGYRTQWQQENEEVKQNYADQAESKRQEIDGQISEKVEDTNTQVSEKYAAAETEAAAQKKKAEEEAERKKREEQNKPKSLWQRVKGGISSAFNAIKKAVNKIFDGLRALVKKVIEVAKKAAFALIDLARNAIVGLIKVFGTVLKAIVNVALAAFPKLAEKFNSWIDKAVDFAIEKVNQLADALKAAVAALLDFLGNALDFLLSLYQKAINLIIDALHFLTVGLMEILEGISNLVKSAGEMPGNFWSQVSEEMLGVDITKPLPNEIPLPTDSLDSGGGMSGGDSGSEPTAKILDNKDLSSEDVEVDEVAIGFELDQALMDQLASMPEGASMEIDTASEGGPDKVDEIKKAAVAESLSPQDEVQSPDASMPPVSQGQSGTQGELQSVETVQPGMVGPFNGPGERLAYLGGQMKEGISKWWSDNKVAIIAGLILGITGVILANILTGGAILAALPLLMQIIGALFLGAALANATGYFGSYLGLAFPGNIGGGAIALARAAAIIVVELVSSLLFAGKGVVKGAKAAVKTIAKQGVKGALKTGTKAAKTAGVKALKETGKAAKELGKVAVGGAKATVKNGKLVLGGISKGIGKGAKSFKSLAKSLAKKMKLKKIKIEKKKFKFFILGEFNPWVLLASGEIKHIDQKDLRRMEGAADDTARLGDMVTIKGGKKQGVIVGVAGKPSSYVDDLTKNFSPNKRKEIFRELKGKKDVSARKAVIQAGESTAELRKAIAGLKPLNFQAHHVIPRELRSKFDDFFKKIGFNIEDGAKNGIMVPPDQGVLNAAVKSDPAASAFSKSAFHKGSHPKYTKLIEGKLQGIARDLRLGLIDKSEAKTLVDAILKNAKTAISNGGGKNLNNVIF